MKKEYKKPYLENLGAIQAITKNAYVTNSDTDGGPDGTAFEGS